MRKCRDQGRGIWTLTFLSRHRSTNYCFRDERANHRSFLLAPATAERCKQRHDRKLHGRASLVGKDLQSLHIQHKQSDLTPARGGAHSRLPTRIGPRNWTSATSQQWRPRWSRTSKSRYESCRWLSSRLAAHGALAPRYLACRTAVLPRGYGRQRRGGSSSLYMGERVWAGLTCRQI